MNARAFFEQVKAAQWDIRDTRRQIQVYRELATDISSKQGQIPPVGGLPSSTVERSAVASADLQDVLQAKLARYNRMLALATEIVDGLEDPIHRRVLTLRYLCGLHHTEVEDELQVSERTVRRFACAALQAVGEVDWTE